MRQLANMTVLSLVLASLSGCLTTVRPLAHSHYHEPRKTIIIKKHRRHHPAAPRKRIVIIR